MKRVGILVGGAWGTALAQAAIRGGLEVVIWARQSKTVEAINESHENKISLPGVLLDPAVRATNALSDLASCDLVFATAPAQRQRDVLQQFAPHSRPGLPVVLCAKGIEQGSLKLMSEVLAEKLPHATPAVLSGPSFAFDVANGLPSAVTLASPDVDFAHTLAEAIATPAFRPYVSEDVIGAEAGGAIKNVLAIACGIVDGSRLGQSAHAGLVARGFAELTRLAVALGGRVETVAGLCGLGDLVLTCSSAQSRNCRFGQALGQGQGVHEALAGIPSVVEGVASAPAVSALARRLGLETPICDAVAAVLAGEQTVGGAIAEVLARPLKHEL